MKLIRLATLLCFKIGLTDNNPQWGRILRDYSRGNVTLYRHEDRNWSHVNGTKLQPEKIIEERMPTIKFISLGTPLLCRGVLYTSHDASRQVDYALDRVKAEWALSQGVCFVRINVDIPTSISGVTAPADVIRAWRRRTPNDPIVLVDRYKGGLILSAMISYGLIRHPDSTDLRRIQPWIFYADGDVGMTNMRKTFGKLVGDALRASHRPSLEERTLAENISALTNITLGSEPRNISSYSPQLRSTAMQLISNTKMVGHMPTPPEARQLHMLFPHGDCMLPRSFVQTGTILFRPSRLSAYVLEVLANSAYHPIDTGTFAMGDQAVMDWLLTNSFGVRWATHTTEHCRTSNFTRACHERSEFTYMSQIHKPFSNLENRFYMLAPNFRVLSSLSNFTLESSSPNTRFNFAAISHSDVVTPQQLPFERRLRGVGLKNEPISRKLIAEDVLLEVVGQEILSDDEELMWSAPEDSSLEDTEQQSAAYDQVEESDGWLAEDIRPISDFASEQFYNNVVSDLRSVKQSNQLYLEHYWDLWQPNTDGYVAFGCSRWSNSPICQIRRRRGNDSPFPYRCGDLLFHLYGCSKNELYSASLHDLLQNDRVCDNILPETLKRIINLE